MYLRKISRLQRLWRSLYILYKPISRSSKYIPTNTPRGFHVETTWKRPFPRRFNVESTWCVCKDIFLLLIAVRESNGKYIF